MYHVLMAVDGDEERLSHQLDAVERLPGRDEITVTVLYVHEVVDTPADEAGKRIIDAINEDIDDLQGLPDGVSRAREALADSGFQVAVSTGTGDPADVILEVAANADVDVVQLAGRKRSPIGKAVFGSVTQRVILESDRPVTVA
jgi:nucleotide-binding universal stress UspA family protein